MWQSYAMRKEGSASSGKTKASVAVRTGLSKAEADALALLFASMGLGSRLQAHSADSFTVLVPPEQLERANELLAEEYPEVLRPDDPEKDQAVLDSSPEQLGVVVAITAACLAAFFFTHGGLDPVGRARMVEMGAITWSLVEAGEYWRLLSAVFLHFDLGHIMSNMVMLWILGPHLAREMKAWPFLLTFVVAGIAGNVASHGGQGRSLGGRGRYSRGTGWPVLARAQERLQAILAGTRSYGRYLRHGNRFRPGPRQYRAPRRPVGGRGSRNHFQAPGGGSPRVRSNNSESASVRLK